MSINRKELIQNLILLVVVVAISVLYFVIDIHQLSLHVLRTGLDIQIPRIPFFSIPYLAFLPWLWGTVIYSFFKHRTFRQLAYSVIIVNLVAFCVYLSFQTYVPRDPIITNDFFSNLLRFIYSHDQPYNCFPSLHSALSAVIATYFLCRKSCWSWAAISMAGLVVISTLFVKQHFVLDAISGIVLGIITTLVVFRLSSNKKSVKT